MTIGLQEAVERARAIVAGASVSAEEGLALEKVLRDDRRFGLARKLLERAAADPALNRDRALRLRVAHKLALATYKDPDLPVDARLDDAERILEASDDL